MLPVETSMLFLDLETAGIENSWLIEEGVKQGIKFGYGGRVVIHHQITDDAIAALLKTLDVVIQRKAEKVSISGEAKVL